MKHVLVLTIGILLWALPVFAADVDRTAATRSINALRSDHNAADLKYSTQLEKAAQAHVEDMVRNGFFSHTGSNGSTIGTRLTRAGYGWCAAAENIASGQRSLAQVMDSWTKSRGHRKNMLNTQVSEFALARGTGHIWVMVLARPGC